MSIQRIHIIFIFLLLTSLLSAQDDKVPNWDLRGYISEMVTVDFTGEDLYMDNLVHNRLNFRWYPEDNLNIYFDLRTRILAGHTVQNFSGLGDFLDFNNDYFELSVHLPEDKSWLFHSMIDRAYLEWYKDNWEIRVGRQRINWGINSVWNPNDLFNAYSYFDFDYVERPGSDAVRLTYYTGTSGSVEFAVNMTDDFDKLTMAGLYKSNLGSYDLQILAGKASEDLVLGLGWAGNLGNAGFKGEISYFIPYKSTGPDDALLATLAIDYAFKNSLYLNLSLLFNSDGSSDQQANPVLLATSGLLTARYLSPFMWSTFLSGSYQINPLIRGGLAFIYFPGKTNGFFISPSIDYSLAEDIDISFISQLYFDKISGDYQALAKLIYIRAKWSF